MNKKWKCGVCGFIHDGDGPPQRCPKCAAAAARFALLDDDAADAVERSRHGNAVLCLLVDLGRRIERACKDGLADDLDPGCADVYRKCLEHTYQIMKLSMTEMQSHVGEGKWG
ncbi:MAG: rubredoxin [Planctomycetes bacterium]|nr:rubredoxin [Planctomycetota bacterium]